MAYNPLKVSLENIIPLTEARDHFSQIVAEVQKDKLYVLTKGGKPAVAIIDVKYLETITGGEVQEQHIEDEIQKAPEKVGRPKMIEHTPPTVMPSPAPLKTPPIPVPPPLATEKPDTQPSPLQTPTPLVTPTPPPTSIPPVPPPPVPPPPTPPPSKPTPPPPPKESVQPSAEKSAPNTPPTPTPPTPPPAAPKPSGGTIDTNFEKSSSTPQNTASTPPSSVKSPNTPTTEQPKENPPSNKPNDTQPKGPTINIISENLDRDDEKKDRANQEDKNGPAQFDGESGDGNKTDEVEDMVID